MLVLVFRQREGLQECLPHSRPCRCAASRDGSCAAPVQVITRAAQAAATWQVLEDNKRQPKRTSVVGDGRGQLGRAADAWQAD